MRPGRAARADAARVSGSAGTHDSGTRDSRREEKRRRSAKPGRVSFRARSLAWSASADDEDRFRRIARRVLITCAIFFLALPWLPIREPDRSQPVLLAEPMARLLLEDKPPPPPKPKPEPVAKAPPVERQVATNKPDPVKPPARKPDAPAKVALNKEAPVPEARVPLPDKPPGEIDAARRKAAGIGLLAMKDDIQELHGAPVAVQLAPVKQGPGVGTGVGVGVGAGNEAGVPVRALITSNATNGSGGINTAGYSKNTGGGGLAGRSLTLVEGVIGGGGGGGAGGGGARGLGDGTGSGIGGGGGGSVKSGSGKPSRALEDVRIVFERNKGSIYAIYNRALREDPTLQGKVVLKLTIAPSGAVTDCKVVSSDLKAPELEAKLLARVRQFEFGAKDVNEMVVSYPVDFLPS
jgi:TonB family protein